VQTCPLPILVGAAAGALRRALLAIALVPLFAVALEAPWGVLAAGVGVAVVEILVTFVDVDAALGVLVEGVAAGAQAARLVADEHAGGALTAGVVVASAAGEGALVLVQEVRVRTGALALGGIHAGLHAGSGGSLSDAGGRLGAGDVDARIAQVDPQAHAAARDVVEDAPGHDTAAVALRLHALVRRAVVRADTYLQRDLRVVALARD